MSKQIFYGSDIIATRIAIDGEFYDVTPAELSALRTGATPESLGLDPSDCDKDC